MTRWTTLDLARPLADLRTASGLTTALCADRLHVQSVNGASSVVSGPEQRGASIYLRTLLERATAYAPEGTEAEVEIRVRWVPR